MKTPTSDRAKRAVKQEQDTKTILESEAEVFAQGGISSFDLREAAKKYTRASQRRRRYEIQIARFGDCPAATPEDSK